jgi:hypothetical protein
VGRPDDRDQAYLDAGYIRCRAHGEWHRPPECAINEDGSVAEHNYSPPATDTTTTDPATPAEHHPAPPPARRRGDVPLMVIAAIGLLIFGVAVCGLLGVIGNALDIWHGWPGIEVQNP